MKYPCILKGSHIWLAFDKSNAAALDSGYGKNQLGINFESAVFYNITAEYLANTYGEVKNKEHAEFIVKLAEVNGFGAYSYSNGDKYFNFRGNCLYFLRDSDIANRGYKQITIPLQPSDTNTNTPEEDFEMKQVAKNNGDNLIFGDADKCKEWPCVGDEVEAKHPSAQTLKGELLAKTKEYAIIQQLGHEQHLHLSAWKFSKPKTPEQELIDKIESVFRIFSANDYLRGRQRELAIKFIDDFNIKPQ